VFPGHRSPEHSNLVYDMIPIAWSLEFLCQQPEQFFAHVDNTPSHGADIALPVLK
jgi:hypothetical protein